MDDKHKVLLDQLVTRMENEELSFYKSAAKFNYIAWYVSATIIIIVFACNLFCSWPNGRRLF